jgi:hypothetical protein
MTGLSLADDSNLRGAHREVQDAAGGGQQPAREQPARAEVGGLREQVSSGWREKQS